MERPLEMDKNVIRISALLCSLLLCATAGAQTLVENGFHWNQARMDGSRSARSELVSRGTAARVSKVVEAVQPQMADLKRVVGYSDRVMTKGYPESPLSNWFADLMLVQGEKITGEKMDVCVGNFGGIRVDMPAGDVIVDDIRSMFPFKNDITILKIRGVRLRELFATMAATNFQVLGGVRIEVRDKTLERVEVGGEPLDDSRLYTVITNAFLLHGGDGLFLADISEVVNVLPNDMYETVMDYINDCTAAGKHLSAESDARIIIRRSHPLGKLTRERKYTGEDVSYTRGAKTAAHRLNILHTNDTHSHIDPIRAGEYAGCGGVVERACFVDSVRQADKARNVLLVDAGDFEQGTPYFTLFRGKVEIGAMNAMGYDVATLGNHEFDNGIEDLVRRLAWAKFDIVLSNYNLEGTGLEKRVSPYVIIRRGGLKIGVLGALTDVRSVVDADIAAKLRYLNPVEPLNSLAAYLKQSKRCDMVIVLSHLGIHGERGGDVGDLALAPQLRNVDLIVGGHSHTALEGPCVLKDADGKDIVVVQDYCWGINVGEIKIN